MSHTADLVHIKIFLNKTELKVSHLILTQLSISLFED